MSPNRVVGIVVFALCLAGIAWAQGGATGAISGTVQDASGAAVAGAKVDVISDATNLSVRQVTSDSAGLFTVPL